MVSRCEIDLSTAIRGSLFIKVNGVSLLIWFDTIKVCVPQPGAKWKTAAQSEADIESDRLNFPKMAVPLKPFTRVVTFDDDRSQISVSDTDCHGLRLCYREAVNPGNQIEFDLTEDVAAEFANRLDTELERWSDDIVDEGYEDVELFGTVAIFPMNCRSLERYSDAPEDEDDEPTKLVKTR